MTETETETLPVPITPAMPIRLIKEFQASVTPFVMSFVIVVIIALALFLGKRIADNIVPDVPGVTLTDVHTIDELRSRFNQDQGAPRLVLFVSPT